MGSIKIDRGSINSRSGGEGERERPSSSRSTRSRSKSSSRSQRRSSSRSVKSQSRKSTRSRRRERDEVEEDSRGRRKKAKKKDPTMMIVGCILGGAILLIFIIVGIAHANKPAPQQHYTSSAPQIPQSRPGGGQRVNQAQLTEAQRKIMNMDLSKEMNADNELLKQRQRARSQHEGR